MFDFLSVFHILNTMQTKAIFDYEEAIATFREEFPEEQKNVYFLTDKYYEVEKAHEDFAAASSDENRRLLTKMFNNFSYEIEDAFRSSNSCVFGENPISSIFYSKIKLVMPLISTRGKAQFPLFMMDIRDEALLADIHPYAPKAVNEHGSRAAQIMNFYHETGHALTIGTSLFGERDKDGECQTCNRHLAECAAETYSYIRYMQHKEYDHEYANWNLLRRTLNMPRVVGTCYALTESVNGLFKDNDAASVAGLHPSDTVALATSISKAKAMNDNEIRSFIVMFVDIGNSMLDANIQDDAKGLDKYMAKAVKGCGRLFESGCLPSSPIIRNAGYLLKAFSEIMPSFPKYQEALTGAQEKAAGYAARNKINL